MFGFDVSGKGKSKRFVFPRQDLEAVDSGIAGQAKEYLANES